MQWLKEGDNNTKFFHKMANARRSTNGISSLFIGDTQVVNDDELKRHVGEFFTRPEVDGLNFPVLGEEQAKWLERLFDEEEVKMAMWSLDGDKAPEPDGFSIAFYKVCWEVIRVDLMLVINDFFRRGFLDKGSDTTYISLIPKKEGAEHISNFRPISLVGSIYKIVSKCLALRLIDVLSRIVPKEQWAFLKGSLIDGVLFVNECIDARLRKVALGLLSSWTWRKPMTMSIEISFFIY